MRNPKEIAADLQAQAEQARSVFVPRNVAQAVDTLAEFAVSVAATLDAAGLIPEPPPAPAAAPAPRLPQDG